MQPVHGCLMHFGWWSFLPISHSEIIITYSGNAMQRGSNTITGIKNFHFPFWFSYFFYSDHKSKSSTGHGWFSETFQFRLLILVTWCKWEIVSEMMCKHILYANHNNIDLTDGFFIDIFLLFFFSVFVLFVDLSPGFSPRMTISPHRPWSTQTSARKCCSIRSMVIQYAFCHLLHCTMVISNVFHTYPISHVLVIRLQCVYIRIRSDRCWQIIHNDGQTGGRRSGGHHTDALQRSIRSYSRNIYRWFTVYGKHIDYDCNRHKIYV